MTIIYSDDILQRCQALAYVLLDASSHVIRLSLYELFANDILVELNVAVGNRCHDLLGHLGNLLAILALMAAMHERMLRKVAE